LPRTPITDESLDESLSIHRSHGISVTPVGDENQIESEVWHHT
jgi:hypothetical protein